jgi:hypothetical protein
MKKTVLIILAAALALPLSAETWKDVSLMDANCAAKAAKMKDPDEHSTSCAMKCAKSGYGAVVNGKFVKFDTKGNDLTSEALKKTDKKDHLRATVQGEMKDGVIQVSKLTLE